MPPSASPPGVTAFSGPRRRDCESRHLSYAALSTTLRSQALLTFRTRTKRSAYMSPRLEHYLQYAHARTYIRTRTHMHTRIYTHIHIQTHTHTHTHIWRICVHVYIRRTRQKRAQGPVTTSLSSSCAPSRRSCYHLRMTAALVPILLRFPIPFSSPYPSAFHMAPSISSSVPLHPHYVSSSADR
jgi:hypothetical protein